MISFLSCKEAIATCLEKQSFSMAHLYQTEKTMNIHIHDCYEVYYSISGGRQFLIDKRFYDFQPGDIFFINQFESHYLSQIEAEQHERIILNIHPEYLKRFSTENTDLNVCFSVRNTSFGNKLSLTKEEQKRFLYFIHRLSETHEFGQEIYDQACFLEMVTWLNQIFVERVKQETSLNVRKQNPAEKSGSFHEHLQIQQILSYINQNLAADLTLSMLADHFYISTSYLNKIFRQSTGTTINKYIIAQRISYAKVLLREGCSVTDTCSRCGFRDYSNFLRAFTKSVGISPRKYAQFSS